MAQRPPSSMVRMTLYLSPTEDAILDRLAPLHTERGRPSRSAAVRHLILGTDRNATGEPLPDESDRIFSGDGSHAMWARINTVKPEITSMALYALGCKCQELEAVVRKSLARIEALGRKETK